MINKRLVIRVLSNYSFVNLDIKLFTIEFSRFISSRVSSFRLSRFLYSKVLSKNISIALLTLVT